VTSTERISTARRDVRGAQMLMLRAANHPDPVETRRASVRAASLLRSAADTLDDRGRLTE